MTFKTGYIYACTWKGQQAVTFYNLVTSTTKTKIIGRCVQASDSKHCDPNHIVHWDATTWNDSRNHIIELGKLEDLPELLI